MSYAVPVLNLGAVVEKTGVQAHSLRAWERRYGLPTPHRSEGGHRLYSLRDVDIIHWLADRQSDGLTIGRAVALWKQLIAGGQDPLVGAPTREPAVQVSGAEIDLLRQAWVEACLAFDEASAEQAVVEGFACLDAEIVILGLLQRGLSHIGDLWYEGKATVQQEHFATELAVRRVEALIVANPPPTRKDLILAAGPPGELHGFGLLLVTLLLRRRGWAVLHLGADVPLAHLGETVAGRRPSIVITAAQQLETAATLQGMAAKVREQGVVTAYGGWVFDRIPELRSRIPGHYLGQRLESVPERIEALMGTPLPPAVEPPSTERLEALAHFREQEPLIGAEVCRLLGGADVHGEHLAAAVQQLPRHLDAALRLCDLRYIEPGLDWIEGLLANLGAPSALLWRYLEAYHQAASLHLDERGRPVLDWLAGLQSRTGRETRDDD